MIKPARAVTVTCSRCTYFQNDPAEMEAAFPGLTSMSSGFASVRAADGICRLHEIYLAASDSCPNYHSNLTAPPAVVKFSV